MLLFPSCMLLFLNVPETIHPATSEVAERVGDMTPDAFILENVASLAWRKHVAYLKAVLKKTLTLAYYVACMRMTVSLACTYPSGSRRRKNTP